jgi:hypothetical protein
MEGFRASVAAAVDMLGNTTGKVPDLEGRFPRILRRHKQGCRREFRGKGGDGRAACYFIQPVDGNGKRAFAQHRAEQAAVLKGQAPLRHDAKDAGDDPGGLLDRLGTHRGCWTAVRSAD